MQKISIFFVFNLTRAEVCGYEKIEQVIHGNRESGDFEIHKRVEADYEKND